MTAIGMPTKLSKRFMSSFSASGGLRITSHLGLF
jgi:hypothetical protein